jgi:hypothetical protein
MRLFRRQFLHFAAGTAALPVLPRFARASLSDAAGTHHCRRGDVVKFSGAKVE